MMPARGNDKYGPHGGDELFSGYPVFKLAGLLDADRRGVFFNLLKSIKPSEVPRLVYFMAPVLVIRFVVGPVSGTLNVANRPEFKLAFDVLALAAILASFAAANLMELSFETTISVLAVLLGSAYLFHVFRTARAGFCEQRRPALDRMIGRSLLDLGKSLGST